MYRFIKTNMEEVEDLYKSYAQKNDCGDDFWEEHIYNGDIYKITLDDNTLGIFSIFNNEKLTSFYLLEPLVDAQSIFSSVLSEFNITSAFVITKDEPFLSLALDLHKEVKIQAYFFINTERTVPPAAYPREWVKKATMADLSELLGIKFFGEEAKRIEDGTLYVMRDPEGNFMCAGIIEPLKLQKNKTATGMYTQPEFRQKGVGRSMIMHLKDITIEQGKTTSAGCWYYNHLSKRTLESTGYITKTRLLNILF